MNPMLDWLARRISQADWPSRAAPVFEVRLIEYKAEQIAPTCIHSHLDPE